MAAGGGASRSRDLPARPAPTGSMPLVLLLLPLVVLALLLPLSLLSPALREAAEAQVWSRAARCGPGADAGACHRAGAAAEP